MRSLLLRLGIVLLAVSPVAFGQTRLSHSTGPRTSQSKAKLPEVFRQWLEEDVVYIISSEERKEFLSLKSDDERDHFIDNFWEARNPDPGSSINVYKEEHYRRLAYVRQNFGDDRYNDGWRTDMGRIYITLGPPKQRAPYHIGRATREIEVWFYESPSPALPSFFNVMFYKRGYGDNYTIYSPTEDGPTRLVTTDEKDAKAALKTLEQGDGSEVKHTAVTLIPSEPVNWDDPTPSMASDMLLADIRGLADMKLEKDRIAKMRAAAREKVTASVFTGANTSVLDTAVLRNDRGETTVHVLFRNESANDRLIGTLADRRTGYDMTLNVRVSTLDGKALYQQTDTFASGVSDAAAKIARSRPFAGESRLPLPAGEFHVEATLTNNLNHEATRVSRTVSVPVAHPETLEMSDLVAYTKPAPIPDPAGQLPFSVSRLRFTPHGAGTALIHAGDPMPVFFQIWFPHSDAASPVPEVPRTVQVHYVIGSVAATTASPFESDENVEVKNLDAAGNLLTGRVIDTTKLHPGTYRLAVKVSEPGVAHAATAAMTLKVLPPETEVNLWTAYGAEDQHTAWRDEVLRGVAAERLDRIPEAKAAYQRALQLNPDAAEAQARLDGLSRKVATASSKAMPPTP